MRIHFFKFFLLLFCLILSNSCQTTIDNKAEKVKFLGEIGHTLHTDQTSLNFSDLQFLKKSIGDAEIVMLGEISHADGGSLEAKSRLVKFLHEEMDFEVIVFESGLFECYNAWNAILTNDIPIDSAFSKGVFPVWAKSKYVKDLIHYIEKQAVTNHKLELAGMDIQLTGSLSTTERKDILVDHLVSIDSTASFSQFKNLHQFFEEPKQFFSSITKNDSSIQDSIISELSELEYLFSKADLSIKKNKIFHRHIQNLQKFLYFMWNVDLNNINPEIANIRDEEMGKNLIWLKEEIFPSKKIIVWGANSHLIHNRNLLYYKDKMHPMGEYIHSYYGTKSFVVGFTCYDGNIGSIVQDYVSKVPMASNKSIEYLMHEAGYNNAFFDTKDLRNNDIIENEFVARFLGFTNKKAAWSKMFDGFFFIDTMKPNEKIE
jgi:erythromycin esterase-like protein